MDPVIDISSKGQEVPKSETDIEEKAAETDTAVVVEPSLSQWQYLKWYFGSWDGWIGDYVSAHTSMLIYYTTIV